MDDLYRMEIPIKLDDLEVPPFSETPHIEKWSNRRFESGQTISSPWTNQILSKMQSGIWIYTLLET